MQKPKKEHPVVKRLVISPRVLDPFSNMIYKKNKSPILKPVYVKSKGKIMKTCRSQESMHQYECLSNRDSLPPISPLFKHSKLFDFKIAHERNSLKTPNFKNNSKKHKIFNLANFSESNNLEISFGETDENVGNVNEKVKKYH